MTSGRWENAEPKRWACLRHSGWKSATLRNRKRTAHATTFIAKWLALVCVGLLGLADSVHSQTTFQVSADVVEGCSYEGSTAQSGIPFGSISFGSHPATANGTITASVMSGSGSFVLRCAPGSELQMTVSGGQHQLSANRHLKRSGGTQTLAYRLYLDAARSVAIPAGLPISVTIPASGELPIPIYAEIDLGNGAKYAGIYSDSLSVSIVW